MATAPTKTIKITQTIRLDIDFANVEAVRIVDVDLLILLKDGQRLIVPEGAVRAMMDNEFSINFKGRQMSVASLMSLQTFEARRASEITVASTPQLPESNQTKAKPTQDIDRLALDGTGEVGKTGPNPEPASPAVVTPIPMGQVRASTEADSQARQAATDLDRQLETRAESASPLPAVASSAPLSAESVLPGSVPPQETVGPTEVGNRPTPVAATMTPTPEGTSAVAGLSSAWKYAVGVLGAGVAALVSRGASKAVADAISSSSTPGSDLLSISGTLALGPFTASTVKLLVLGQDASGKTIRLSGDIDPNNATADAYILENKASTVQVNANGGYTLKLNVKSYTGAVVVVMRDATADAADYLDEATNQAVSLGDLTLRSSGVINGTTVPTINITPLSELAVRSALGATKSATPTAVPTDTSITLSNTAVAKAFGLGASADVASSPVITVLSPSYKPEDNSVASKYALALASLSGLDSKQSAATPGGKVQQTLDGIEASFATNPISQGSLVATVQQQLIEGALQSQPVVRNQSDAFASLDMSKLMGNQLAVATNNTNTTSTLVLVSSPVSVLGTTKQVVYFHFNRAVTDFSTADIQLTAGFTLSELQRSSTDPLTWTAQVSIASGSTTASNLTSGRISVSRAGWSGTQWSWDVDTQAPTAPTITLVAQTSGNASDSGLSLTDGISNVKTPRVRLTLNSDNRVGDTVILKQTTPGSKDATVGASGTPLNQKTVVLGVTDIAKGYVEIDLQDMGSDGDFVLTATETDAAGNTSATTSTLNYHLQTQIPSTPVLSLNDHQQIEFGSSSPPGIVNFKAREVGFTLSGTQGQVGARISINWGGKVKETVVTNANGQWSMVFAKDDIPTGESTSVPITLTQYDVAGNTSAAKRYNVEVSTAGVTSKVLSLEVADNSGSIASERYTNNAQGVVAARQSTDDTTPVLTVRLDQGLRANDVIEVFDGAITSLSRPLFQVSTAPTRLENGQYVWVIDDAQWAAAKRELPTGTHQLTARVRNLHTWDEGVELPIASQPSFQVQTLDFNQLLLSENGDNQIPQDRSAGFGLIEGLPVNQPILGGTLQAPLGSGERLAVYDTFNGTSVMLGTATLIPVLDTSTNAATGAYTWRFAPTSPLANGDHTLSVRLESATDTPLVRLAMSQDVSIALPVLSIAPAADSPNGLSTDSGVSDSDGISNIRTPFLRLVFPLSGRRVGDTINILDQNNNNKVVATQQLTASNLQTGMLEFATDNLLSGSGTTNTSGKTLKLVARIIPTSGGLSVPDSAPLLYTLDTVKPDSPLLKLASDTSGSQFITSNPTLLPVDLDSSQNALYYQVKKGSTVLTGTGASITPSTALGMFWKEMPTISTSGTADGTYLVSAVLVDLAGNVSSVTAPTTTLGQGSGSLKFTLDTTKPLTLSKPTLQLDSSNGLTGFATDGITSNFRLSDPVPTTETNAKLEYKVQHGANSSGWVSSYLEAIGAASGLSGTALTNWMAMTDSQAQANLLDPGVYAVTRRQTDLAGNASAEAPVLSFTLDTHTNPLTVSLKNDTSQGQNQSSDVNIQVGGFDGTPGADLKVVYELTRYTDANRKTIVTDGVVTTTNTYTPPTLEGFYTLRVTQTNKAGLSNTNSLSFQFDKTPPTAPASLLLDPASDSFRDNSAGHTPGGQADDISNHTTPTLRLTLGTGANAAQPGDQLQLYLDGDLTQPWGTATLQSTDLKQGWIALPANTLAPAEGQPLGSTDGAYTFKARWVDVAGNASGFSPAFTYTLDTVAQVPTLSPIQLANLPENFINHQSSVTFSGTGETSADLLLSWTSGLVTKTYHTLVGLDGQWRLTVNAADFPPDTDRLAFGSTVTVSQTDPSRNTSVTSAALSLALNTAAASITATITEIQDQNTSSVASGTLLRSYAINKTGVVASGQTTDEHKPLLSGTLSDALPASINASIANQMVVRVYDGGNFLGNASVSDKTWTFQVPTALTDGSHNFSVDVYDPLTLQASTKSASYGMSSNVLTLTAFDATPGHENNWVITTTPRPTFQGALKAALAIDEVVAVYDQKDDGPWTLLGTVSDKNIQPSSSGYIWSFDMPQSMFGQHTYRVQIEQRAVGTPPVALLAIEQQVKYDFNGLTLDPASDTGRSSVDNLSSVKTPTVLLHLADSAAVGDAVILQVANQPMSYSTVSTGSDGVNDITLQSSSGSPVAYNLTTDDIAAGLVRLKLPDISQLLKEDGGPYGDNLFGITATVGAGSVVSPLNYALDTTAPTYTPVVKLQQVTGDNTTSNTTTGFTSNKTLLSNTKVGSDKTVYEQVQVINSDSNALVRDWTSLTDFNSSTLADGHYTLKTRMIDTAGNEGHAGANVALNLDTQAATVASLSPTDSAATTSAWKQDAYVNKLESGATMQFSLVFREKVKGVTKDNLQLSVSGASSTLPTIDGVAAQDADERGYATTWIVTLKDLSKLTDGETLQLSVKNGLQILDQAGNLQSALTSSAASLSTDLNAAYTWTAVDTLEDTPRHLLSAGEVTSFTVNQRTQSQGVKLSGSVQGVEAGQNVALALWTQGSSREQKGDTLTVRVQADGSWSTNLNTANWLSLLVDRENYDVVVTTHDLAGNAATGPVVTLKSRLNASIEVNTVEANFLTSKGEMGTVLDFDVLSSGDPVDAYVNSKDKQNGAADAISADDTGFTVRGTSNIGEGQLVTVVLTKVGVTMSPLLATGTVDADGQWFVHFSSNVVSNLGEGTWRFIASGKDADENWVNSDDPSTQTDPRSRPTFTVDTQASVILNALGVDNHVNKTRDGDTFKISGTFLNIDAGNTLTFTLRDKNNPNLSTQVLKTWSDKSPLTTNVVDATTTTWTYEIPFSELDALTFAHSSETGQAEVAKLSLTVSTSDKVGNVAAQTVQFDLDRTPPETPVPGDAVRKIAGDSLASSITTSLRSTTTLRNTSAGVFIAPNAIAPTATDVASVLVDAVTYSAGPDQWRVGTRRWSMNTENLNTEPLTVGVGADAFNVVLSYTLGSDNVGHLVIKSNGGGLLTPTQVQTVLRSLAWVNTSSDLDLDQMERKFDVSYRDAHGNVGSKASVTFAVDTYAPTVLGSLDTEVVSMVGSGSITVTPNGAGDSDTRANTLNSLTTSLTLKATITADQATGGWADFYVGSTKVGSTGSITNDADHVQVTVGSGTSNLQSLIASGGVVSVKLYDAFGNMITTTGPTLIRDIVAPTIDSITSTTADGAYKAGDAINLTLMVTEEVTEGSSLVLTLGSVVSSEDRSPLFNVDNPRTVVLTRDASNAKKFTGTYTVKAGDNSADLAVIDAASNPAGVSPRDAAANPMSFNLSGLADSATLRGSKSLVIDTTAPNAVDLDKDTVPTEATRSAYFVFADVSAGKAIDSVIGLPTESDIATITVKVTGADATHDELVLDTTTISLNGAAVSTTAIISGTDSGYSYAYDGTTVSFTKTDGTVFTAANVQALEQALKFKTSASATQGDRTFEINHIDWAKNTGTSATQTVKVDTIALAPSVALSSSSDPGGIGVVTGKSFTLSGTAEKGAQVSVTKGSRSLGTVTASTSDGTWSLAISGQLVVSGLKKADSSASTANGTYELLSSTEAAALGAFSNSFVLSGTATLDLSKPVYSYTASGVTWYVWAAVGSGYRVTQQTSTTEWYSESVAGSSALFPETVSTWYGIKVSASVLQTELDANFGVSDKRWLQDGASIDNVSGTSNAAMSYSVKQTDVAGNTSDAANVSVRVDTVKPEGLDLDSSAAGRQSALLTQTRASLVVSGVSFVSAISTPLNTDTKTIKCVLSGGGLDLANDKLVLDVDLALGSTLAEVTGKTVGGVSGLSYDYDSTTKTLTLKKSSGTLTGAEVKAIVEAIKLKDAFAASGDRVATITLTDVAGLTSDIATATLRVANDGLVLDLDNVTMGTQLSTSRYLTTTAALSTGVALNSALEAPTATNITTLKLTLSGAGLDTTSDKLTLDTDLSLGSDLTTVTGKTVGTVTGLSYGYVAGSKTLTITKTASGTFLSGSDVKNIIQAIKFKNAAATPLEGERVIQLAVASAAETGSASSVSLTLDTQAPVLDLNASLAGVQTTSSMRANANKMTAGQVFLSGIAPPVTDDIKTIKWVLSGAGLNTINDKLVLDAEVALNATVSATSGSTVGGVGGLSYSYDSGSKTLTLSKSDSTALTRTQVKSVLEAIKLKNTTVAEGDRIATITLTDMAGNTSTATTSTLTVDLTAPASVTASLAVATVKSYGLLSLGDTMGTSNAHNLATPETTQNFALPGAFTSTTFLAAIRGVYGEWGGLGITANANTTDSLYYTYKSFSSALSSGSTSGSFDLVHQSGAYSKGGAFYFTNTSPNLTLTHSTGYYYMGDVYGSATHSDSNAYDIGNIKLLYEINSSLVSLTPTIGVTYDGTKAIAGDRIDLYDGFNLVGSATLASGNIGSASMTMNVDVTSSLSAGDHSIVAKFVDTAGTTVTSSVLSINIPVGTVAPTVSGLKINGFTVNNSDTTYAMVSSTAVASSGATGDALTLTGTLAQKSLVTLSVGGQTIAFGEFSAGNFSLKAAQNVIAPGYYNDVKITVVDTSTSPTNAGQTTVLQKQTLGYYWLGQLQGDTNGGKGDDTILAGSMASSTGSTVIQTGLGNDTVSVGTGGYGKTTNLTATVSDFTLGVDHVAVRGQSITADNLTQYLTSYTASSSTPGTSTAGTKLVIDLDGTGAGATSYTLYLAGVTTIDLATMKTVFGV